MDIDVVSLAEHTKMGSFGVGRDEASAMDMQLRKKGMLGLCWVNNGFMPKETARNKQDE